VIWLLWLLLYPQSYPDCHPNARERDLIEHYLSWSAAKDGLSFAGSRVERYRCAAVRSGDDLHLELPLRKQTLRGPVPARFSFRRTILAVSSAMIPPVGEYSWNPGSFQESFATYLQEYGIGNEPKCSIQIPGQIRPWMPSPLNAAKEAILKAMESAARQEVASNGEWSLSVAEFNVDDPYVNAVLTDAKTGEHMLGTFAINRHHSEPVAYDRLMATDIERISPRELVGSNPITVRLSAAPAKQ
jgi:hypothetical protein